MKPTVGLIVLLCLFTIAGASHATAYKWVDEKGTVTFRDTPPPEGSEGEIVSFDPLGKTTYDTKRPQSEEVESDTATHRGTTAAETTDKVATRTFPEVDLYVTSWCGYCAKAKAFLRINGVSFREYDVEKDPLAARRHRQFNPNGGVPVAVIGNQLLLGFSPEAYNQALGL